MKNFSGLPEDFMKHYFLRQYMDKPYEKQVKLQHFNWLSIVVNINHIFCEFSENNLSLHGL